VIEHRDGVFESVDDGIWMLETGNFGSRVLDDPPGRLAVFMVLCDRCLVSRRDRLRAIELTGEGARSSGWKWLNEWPELLLGRLEIPSPLAPRSFGCPHCNAAVGGAGVTSGTCGRHGPMIEQPT